MWYLLQIVVFIAVVWYLRALGDTISLPAGVPIWIAVASAYLASSVALRPGAYLLARDY